MLLMCPVNGNTFFTVAMITAGFLTWAVIFVCIFCPKRTGKFFLNPKPLRTVTFMKFLHCMFFCFVSVNNHSTVPFYSPTTTLQSFL